MLSPLRNRFGIPGVISVIALVFAMFGGAYAASDSSSGDSKASASAVKKGPRGPRGPKGPAGLAGPAGPQGPAGPAGAKGDTGSAGAPGAAGADGKTVLNGTATPTGAVGVLGDFYIETDVSKIYGPKASSGANGGWGSGTDLKGKEGSPWTDLGTLPEGETETGTWGVTVGPIGLAYVGLSFPIQLGENLDAAHVKWMNVGDPVATGCTGGTSGAPKADPGFLCIWVGTGIGSVVIEEVRTPESPGANGAGVTGANLLIGGEEGNTSFGTFAVTAP